MLVGGGLNGPTGRTRGASTKPAGLVGKALNRLIRIAFTLRICALLKLVPLSKLHVFAELGALFE